MMNQNSPQQNVYYVNNIPLFVMDMVRMFQDHPKYKNGMKQNDLVELLQQEQFANGDLAAQIESAIKTLESSGYVRFVGNGYRTLGPLARLSMAKTQKQRATVWNKIQDKF